jgi:DNA modification methylase
MQAHQARLVITDPPYGVAYADKNAFLNTIGPANRIETPIVNDHLTKPQMQALWKAAFTVMAAVMAPGAVIYCFMPQGGDQMMMMMMMMMEGAGIEPRHELIWLKNNHVLGRVDYAYKHEPILYAWKDGGHHFYGDFQTSILEYAKPQKSDLHPTTKPVALIEHLMQNSSRPGEGVYDGFVGAGTTLIAAENLGRVCYACELDPGYVAVTLERYRQLTGIVPTRITC